MDGFMAFPKATGHSTITSLPALLVCLFNRANRAPTGYTQ